MLLTLGDYLDFSRTRLLVACGTHAFEPLARKRFEAGIRSAFEPAEIAWHNCYSSDLTGVDGVWSTHPWLLDRSALLLAVGSVEPHYFAGFTGAHKTLTVGCAAHEDIRANHAHALHPRCRPASLEGNPVHAGVVEMLDALEGRREVLAINLVQSGGRILTANLDEPLVSLDRVLPAARRAFVTTVPAQVDAVVAHVTGALGRTFYQAEKGIKNHEWAVRDGGALVLVADCDDGIGQDDFMTLLRSCGALEEAMAFIEKRGYFLGDHKAVRLRYLTDPAGPRKVRAFLVSSGISAEEASVLGMTKVESADEALRRAGIDPDTDAVLEVDDAANACTRVGVD